MIKTVNIGFVPLTDAAPLIIAAEMGFANEEGLDIHLMREQNWASIRDKLSYGIIDAAHMLLPMALGMSLGVAPIKVQIDFPLVLNMNGNAFVAGQTLAQNLSAQGSQFGDAQSFGQALVALSRARPIRVAVPFMQSMHVTMLRHLVSRVGGNPERVFDFRVSSPSKISQLLTDGDVDGFMVGAPWASNAVDIGVGQLMLTSNAIWAGAPEKVLAMRHDWLEANRDTAERLTRAVYRAANWVADSTNAAVASEVLSRRCYLDISAHFVESNLQGETVLTQTGQSIHDSMALQLDAARVGFPWHSSAGLIASMNAQAWAVDVDEARRVATQSCRTDIYRAALDSIHAPMPISNLKIEGTLHSQTHVGGRNDPVLGPDAFYNGETFDPV